MKNKQFLITVLYKLCWDAWLNLVETLKLQKNKNKSLYAYP